MLVTKGRSRGCEKCFSSACLLFKAGRNEDPAESEGCVICHAQVQIRKRRIKTFEHGAQLQSFPLRVHLLQGNMKAKKEGRMRKIERKDW